MSTNAGSAPADVYQNMLKGCFSIAKSHHQFSRIALDQVHEQNNKVIKGQGGSASVLNSQNDSALIRWEICGPEVARIVSEFEELIDNYCSSVRSSGTKHHEDNENFRTKFLKDSTSVCQKIPYNPFEMDFLTTLNNSDRFEDSVFDNLKKVLPKGEEQVKHFIEERLVFQKIAITEKITKNNFPLLNKTVSPNSTMNFGPVFMNKFRCTVEHRPSLADLVFAEELYGVPHCFAVNVDTMYHGSKSSIKDRLKPCHPPIVNEMSPAARILEASPIIRKLANVSVNNFHEFAIVLSQNVSDLAKGYDPVDIVFDRYFENSQKNKLECKEEVGF